MTPDVGTMYLIEDMSKETRIELEDWIESLGKGLTVLEVFMEFENRFKRLSIRDQTILVSDKVVMFLNAVNVRDRKYLGVLLEDSTVER